MKILFVSDVPLDNPTSGSEQVLFHQATGLRQAGLTVFAITRQEKRPHYGIRAAKGIHEGFYQASPRRILRAFYAFATYPSKHYQHFSQGVPFRAVICHQPFSCFFLLFKTNLKTIPMLYVFHSPSHEEYLIAHTNKGRLKNFVQAGLRRLMERYCLKRAQKIMVLSRYMQQKVEHHHGIPAARIVVNPGGVDLARFKPPQSRKLLKQQLDFPPGKVHLLSVRNLDPRMGLDNLLKCMVILKEKKIDAYLTIGGDGPEKEKLNQLIVAHGLGDMVVMCGFIPNELLPAYYGASDFFILPTRSLEGFGLVTPEAMACGTPVLGTPVGGTVEILSDFDSQLLFRDTSIAAMVDGIVSAVQKKSYDEQWYNLLRQSCREYIEKKYSWDRHNDELRKTIEMITQNEK